MPEDRPYYHPTDLGWHLRLEPPVPHPYTAWMPDLSKVSSYATSSMLTRPDWLIRLPTVVSKRGHSYAVLSHFILASHMPTTFNPAPCRNVSIATHCSVDKLHHIAAMAEASDMVISVAVLVRKSIVYSLALIKRLRECSSDVERLVDFTLVFMTDHNEYQEYFKQNAGSKLESFSEMMEKNPQVFDSRSSCSDVLANGLSMVPPTLLRNIGFTTIYPVALMQNIAQRSILSKYTLALEPNMLPSVALGAMFESALSDPRLQLHQGASQLQAAFVVTGEDDR